jgi:hypothetical protein
MTAAQKLSRKGIQVEPTVHVELTRRKQQKERQILDKTGRPRDVSYSEVIADALGMVRK